MNANEAAKEYLVARSAEIDAQKLQTEMMGHILAAGVKTVEVNGVTYDVTDNFEKSNLIFRTVAVRRFDLNVEKKPRGKQA